ncbi:MAG: IS110 family transposase [Opitutaceae bacterium]|nr:IS110 family transposase [Opitutaceae bacterium]
MHWTQYTVVAQADGASPRPARRFTPAGFLAWVVAQRAEAREVHSCYEAGAFGYVLHRKLVALGIKNVVVRPRDWDEYHKKVKTDRRDALALCGMLERHLAGNTEALCVIRVPSEAEEQSRGQTRQRDSLVKDRGRIGNRGLGTARYYGFDLPARWWRPRAFVRLAGELPAHLYETLARWQALLLEMDRQIAALTALIEAAASAGERPAGVGALTAGTLDREAGEWRRFQNRREVASYTGLIPGEHSSGASHRQGAITKHGNRRMRTAAIETAWRLLRFQPGYHAVKRLGPALQQARLRGQSARRRKLLVALARQFVVDWWRLRTGRASPAQLGLRLAHPPPVPVASP